MSKERFWVRGISNCARCGGFHPRLMAKKFKRKVKTPYSDYGYWAMCPIAKEPILIKVTP